MAKTEFNIWLERTARKPPQTATRKSDGDGLYILAEPSGGMYWRYDYRFGGKRKTFSIGRYPALSLAEARVERGRVRTLLDKGVDPSAEKQVEKSKDDTVKTVKDAAEGWDAQNEKQAVADKRSEKTRARDERMARYIVAAFGGKNVLEVAAKNLSDLLNTFEDAGSYATRIRVQSAAIHIMGFAQGKGWLGDKPNPFVGISFGKAYTAPDDAPRPAIIEADTQWRTPPMKGGHSHDQEDGFEEITAAAQGWYDRASNATGHASRSLPLWKIFAHETL